MALQKDIEKIEKLLEEKETISVISAVGENGNPISQVGRKLTMWEKEGSLIMNFSRAYRCRKILYTVSGLKKKFRSACSGKTVRFTE